MPKYLIISCLQRDNDPSSLQFGRLRSNRFGENRLTGHCRAVFSKQAAPRSHAFFSCHEPLPPGTRCGELRGGLSSRKPATATQFRWIIQRNCCALRSGGLQITPEHRSLPRLNTKANHAETLKAAAAESACRQYRAARWFLLPEVELRRGVAAADCKKSVT